MKIEREVLKKCHLCPRNCGIDRTAGKMGFCGAKNTIRLARAALHMWEEPCISGKSGSGAVFFSGCPLHCIFCQNGQIANGAVGKEVSEKHLSEIFLKLQEQGANNINLVTPDHYVPFIIPALEDAKSQGLTIPIVYNTGGYVNIETLQALEGLIDVYLPDFKYSSPELAKRFAKAEDYPIKVKAAISEMVRQTGAPLFRHKEKKNEMCAKEFNLTDGTEEILMEKGTIVRHLVLPGWKKDSKNIIKYLLETYGSEIYISIMNQYTPVKYFEKIPELNRKVSEREYEDVVDFAITLGIENGFIQEGDTARESFIPAFDYAGI